LGSKIDECQIRVENIASTYISITNPNCRKGVIPQDEANFIINSILDAEFEVLSATGFEMEIELPFDHLAEARKYLRHDDISMVFQKAEKFINDCYHSD